MQLGQPTPDGRMFNPAGFTHRDLPSPSSTRTGQPTPPDTTRLSSPDPSNTSKSTGTPSEAGDISPTSTGPRSPRRDPIPIHPRVSADLTDATAEQPGEGHLTIWPNLNRYYTQARLAALTIVPIPAFPGAHQHHRHLPALTAAATITPHRPPRDWFTNPNLTHPTPLTVTPTGRIYGHVALTDTCHTGLNGCTRIPRDDTFAEYLSHGTVICDNDEAVPVGQIFVGGPHADGTSPANKPPPTTPTTTYTWGDVTVGYDNHGIWCAGAVRPDIGETLLYHARASALSGDWRPAKTATPRTPHPQSDPVGQQPRVPHRRQQPHHRLRPTPNATTMHTDTDEPDGTAELATQSAGTAAKTAPSSAPYQRRGTRTAPAAPNATPPPNPRRRTQTRVTAAHINKAFRPLPTQPPELAKWARDSHQRVPGDRRVPQHPPRRPRQSDTPTNRDRELAHQHHTRHRHQEPRHRRHRRRATLRHLSQPASHPSPHASPRTWDLGSTGAPAERR